MSDISARLAVVRQRIERAAHRAHRPPGAITLVGVTKGVGVGAIDEAAGCGLTDVGENRVQEAQAKHELLQARWDKRGGTHAAGQSLRWHLIGHLQRNKVPHALALFDVIHSIDSLDLISALARRLSRVPLRSQGCTPAEQGTPLAVFLQVNVSGESTKHGCRVEEVTTLARALMGHPWCTLAGVMTMAPLHHDPEMARPYFRRLRECRDTLAATLGRAPSTLQLSMGMSQDFEVAIEEGADLVRIGTAIFGGMRGTHPFLSTQPAHGN